MKIGAIEVKGTPPVKDAVSEELVRKLDAKLEEHNISAGRRWTLSLSKINPGEPATAGIQVLRQSDHGVIISLQFGADGRCVVGDLTPDEPVERLVGRMEEIFRTEPAPRRVPVQGSGKPSRQEPPAPAAARKPAEPEDSEKRAAGFSNDPARVDALLEYLRKRYPNLWVVSAELKTAIAEVSGSKKAGTTRILNTLVKKGFLTPFNDGYSILQAGAEPEDPLAGDELGSRLKCLTSIFEARQDQLQRRAEIVRELAQLDAKRLAEEDSHRLRLAAFEEQRKKLILEQEDLVPELPEDALKSLDAVIESLKKAVPVAAQ